MNFGSILNDRTTGSASYAGPRESETERKKKVKELNLSVTDLFDTSKPWVLVDNGSILGYFDWVPKKLRVGSWSPAAPAMLFLMVYTAICGIVAASQSPGPASSPADYPAYLSGLWFYNLLGFVWISGISVSVLVGPAGPRAWATFTVWSWTILQVRHGLAVLAPWLERESFLFKVLELSQFPMLMMHGMTFFVWNFILMPFVYFFLMETEETRKSFLAYFTKFRLIQLHVCNIVFAYVNGVCASPSRELTLADFMASYSIIVLYAMWYLLVLDRIGVHLYPIFSPRSPWMMFTWSGVIAAHYAGFLAWKSILAPAL